MADSATPNYNLSLPEVGASKGSWGGKLNNNFTAIDSNLSETASVSAKAKKNAGPTPFDFGAVNDGVADDAPAIQAAMNAVAAQGGGAVFFPATGKPYIIGAKLLHDTKVSLKGHAGKAELRAKAGLADTMIETREWATLVAAGTSAAGGSQSFVFDDLLIDCNRAQNGADTTQRGDGILLYGRDFTLRNVTVKDAPRHGIRCSYVNASGAFGTSPYHANLENFTIDVCGGTGIIWQISDSNWHSVNIASPGQLDDNMHDAVKIERLVRWTNGAIWKKGNSTFNHRYGINNTSAGCAISGVNIETAKTAAVLTTGAHCRFDIYSYNILGEYHFINSGNYNSARITAQKSTLGGVATVVLNSGLKNRFFVLSASEFSMFKADGGNHNIYEGYGYVGNSTPVTGIPGRYDTVKIIADRGNDSRIVNQIGAAEDKGPTSSRPSYGPVSVGTYFDTTIGKPIWWTGTKWIDANGATV